MRVLGLPLVAKICMYTRCTCTCICTLDHKDVHVPIRDKSLYGVSAFPYRYATYVNRPNLGYRITGKIWPDYKTLCLTVLGFESMLNRLFICNEQSGRPCYDINSLLGSSQLLLCAL